MQDIKTRYEHAARFLPGQVERLVLNGEPVIRRSPAGVLYFARENRLPDGRCGNREFLIPEARDGSTCSRSLTPPSSAPCWGWRAVSSPSPTANSAIPA
ncbi:MAG: hypothetical protein V8Q30_08820 [Acutalibacteraceae bacterium]